jgi:hypothetical protein
MFTNIYCGDMRKTSSNNLQRKSSGNLHGTPSMNLEQFSG